MRKTSPIPSLGFRRICLVVAKLLGELQLPRVGVRDRDRTAVAVLVAQVDGAPVDHVRHRELGDVAQRLLVIERRSQRRAYVGQEGVLALGALLLGDVLDHRDRGLDLAVGVQQRRRLQQLPALPAGLTMNRPDQQRLGPLAAEDPHRRDVLHRDRAPVVARDDVVGHDVGGRGLAQLFDGVEAQRLECGAVGVHDPILAIADRHRVAERADDGLEASLAVLEGHPQLIHQQVALLLGLPAPGDVRHERVELPAVAVANGGQRQLHRELGAIRSKRLEFDLASDQRPRAVCEETIDRGGVGGPEALGNDQLCDALRPGRPRAETPNISSARGFQYVTRPLSSIETTALGARSRI